MKNVFSCSSGIIKLLMLDFMIETKNNYLLPFGTFLGLISTNAVSSGKFCSYLKVRTLILFETLRADWASL